MHATEHVQPIVDKDSMKTLINMIEYSGRQLCTSQMHRSRSVVLGNSRKKSRCLELVFSRPDWVWRINQQSSLGGLGARANRPTRLLEAVN